MEQSGYNYVNMFLPTTRQEMNLLGWDQLDVILVTGDSYIDSPYIGSAVIGKVLAQAGYRVGIIAQPEIDSGADICRLGEPVLILGGNRRKCRFDGRKLYSPKEEKEER